MRTPILNIRFTLMISSVVMLLITACLPPEPTATLLPTRTATPVSTPLPSVATAIPAGIEGNAIRMVLVAFDPDEAEERLEEFQEAIVEESGVVLEIELVNSYTEAIAALCNSSNDQVSVAWLDGMSYAAANAQDCGSPLLQVRRRIDRRLTNGLEGVFILNEELGTDDVTALNQRVFCRLGYEDLYTWLLPFLVLQTNNIDLDELESLKDFEDTEALIEAVVADECDGIGLSQTVLQEWVDDNPDEEANLRVVVTTPPFPYNILMFPLEVNLSSQLALNSALLQMSNDDDMAELLAVFLGQDELARVGTDEFVELDEFLQQTGLDFAELGN